MTNQKYTHRDREFWKISIGLGLASLVIFAYLYSVQPLLPVIKSEFNLESTTRVSLVMSFSVIGLITGLIVWGLMSDRHGRRGFIYFSLIVAFIPLLIIPHLTSFNLFIIARFIQGFAIAGLPAAAIAYLGEEVEANSAKIAVALYISNNGFGGMLGRFISGYIADAYSWEITFHFFAISGGILSLIIILLLPKSRNFQKSNVMMRTDIKALLSHIINPNLLLFFILGIILQIAFTGMWTFLPFYLQKAPYFMTLQTISYLFLAYSLGIIGAPIAGALASAFGVRKILIFAVISLSFGILLTYNAALWVIVTGLCIACFGFFTAHSLTAAYVSETARHRKGSASSLYFVSYYIGVACGSTFLAPIWEKFGWSGIISITTLLPLFYIIVVAIITRPNREKRIDR